MIQGTEKIIEIEKIIYIEKSDISRLISGVESEIWRGLSSKPKRSVKKE
jgi:hypothetical protein